MKRMSLGNLVLTLLVVVFLPLLSFSQSVRILSFIDNEPIPFVVVHNPGKTNFILSDSTGRFDLAVFNGEDTLSFSHPSYFNKTLSVEQILFQQKIVYLETQVIQMDEFVVSASKYKESSIKVAAKVDVINPDEVSMVVPATSADLLEQSGSVLVQKSQGGGGSPILRGFEANKVLLVVDGVRMNNAIYRSGHLQNSLTVDNAALERTEVLFGPGSLVYGSDAIGGVVHYSTISPDYKQKLKTNYLFQTSFPDNSTLLHADVSLGTKRFATLTSLSLKNVGHIHIGSKQTGDYPPGFGEQPFYVERLHNKDSIVLNDNPRKLQNTGYQQVDLIQKIKYKVSDRLDLSTNFQFSGSSNIHRYGALSTLTDDGSFKYAEWYYGPQLRMMVAEQGTFTGGKKLCSDAKFSIAYQRIRESRNTRKIGKDFLNKQIEDLNVVNFSADLRKKLSYRILLNYGVEANANYVESNAFAQHIETGETEDILTRYPSDGSTVYDGSVYLHITKDLGAHLKTTFGGRATVSLLEARFDPDLYGFSVPEKVPIANAAPIGMYSVNYVVKRWQFSGIASTGYRTPNVDDIGKVRTKGDDVIVPNTSLTPEYITNLELSVRKRFQDLASVSVTGYIMYLRNAVVREAFTLDGAEYMEIDGDSYRITANTNAQEATVKGVSIDARLYANSFFKMKSSYNYTHGWNESSQEPLGHIPPPYGQTHFMFYHKDYEAVLYFKYAGWKYAWQMPSTGDDNDDQAPEVGFPSWQTVNCMVKFPITKRIKASAGVQNVFDVYYKGFASAVSSPGRTFSVTIKGHM